MDLKRYLPTREELRGYRSLRFLRGFLFKHDLWHFNSHSVSFGALIGGFCTWLPIPLQTIPALILCIPLRCNVPVTIAFVWISNPFTMLAMMVFAYGVGSWLLGVSGELAVQDFSPEALWNLVFSSSTFAAIWPPLLLGAVVCGAVTGLLGFAAVRIYYRWARGR